MKEIRCRYCGRPSEDSSGVCARCERTYEKRPRLTSRAKRLPRREPVEVAEQDVLRVFRAAIQFVDDLHRPVREQRAVGQHRHPLAHHVHGDFLPVVGLDAQLDARERDGDEFCDAGFADAGRAVEQELAGCVASVAQTARLGDLGNANVACLADEIVRALRTPVHRRWWRVWHRETELRARRRAVAMIMPQPHTSLLSA